MFAHDALGSLTLVALEGLGRAAQFQVRAKSASAIDDPAAKHSSLSIVTDERGVEIAFMGCDRIRETYSVERGLGHADTNMRPGNERGVPQQYRVAEHQARRIEIVDWLEKQLLGLHDNFGNLRREECACRLFGLRDHLWSDEGRGN